MIFGYKEVQMPTLTSYPCSSTSFILESVEMMKIGGERQPIHTIKRQQNTPIGDIPISVCECVNLFSCLDSSYIRAEIPIANLLIFLTDYNTKKSPQSKTDMGGRYDKRPRPNTVFFI